MDKSLYRMKLALNCITPVPREWASVTWMPNRQLNKRENKAGRKWRLRQVIQKCCPWSYYLMNYPKWGELEQRNPRQEVQQLTIEMPARMGVYIRDPTFFLHVDRTTKGWILTKANNLHSTLSFSRTTKMLHWLQDYDCYLVKQETWEYSISLLVGL